MRSLSQQFINGKNKQKKQLSRNISFKIKHRFTLTKFNYYLVSKIPIDSDG